MSNIKNQDNGNTQLNQVRNDFNDRVASKKFLGATPEFIGINREDLERFRFRKKL